MNDFQKTKYKETFVKAAKFLFAGFFLLAALGLAFWQYNGNNNANVSPRITYHGPNPKIVIYEVAQDEATIEILGVEKILPPSGLAVSGFPTANDIKSARNEKVEIQSDNNYEIVMSDPEVIPDTNTDEPMVEETPAADTAPNFFGIAAGGGLIYLGQSDLDAYFTGLQALGVKWVRWDIDWALVQARRSSSYDWSGADRVAETARRFGIESVAIITYTPEWARSPVCRSDWQCAPADPAVFGRFAGVVAARYQGLISYFEIWNEPNYPYFWMPAPNITAYAGILKEAYLEIKKANPDAIVLSGGLTPSADDPDGSISPITFLTGLYALDHQTYFDAISYHPYTYPALPSYIAPWNGWQKILQIRQLMAQFDDDGKKIWITEYGAPTGGPGQVFQANQLDDFAYGEDYMSEQAQAEMLAEALVFYEQNRDWLGPIFLYSLQDIGNTRETPENFFGLLRYNGTPKPAYAIFADHINKTE